MSLVNDFKISHGFEGWALTLDKTNVHVLKQLMKFALLHDDCHEKNLIETIIKSIDDYLNEGVN